MLDEVLLYSRLEKKDDCKFEPHSEFLKGLSSYKTLIHQSVPISEISGIEYEKTDNGRNRIKFFNFPAGSVLIIRFVLLTCFVTQCGFSARIFSGWLLHLNLQGGKPSAQFHRSVMAYEHIQPCETNLPVSPVRIGLQIKLAISCTGMLITRSVTMVGLHMYYFQSLR